MSIREFCKRNFLHFNAAALVAAADDYAAHLAQGGKMFVSMAGAMSTAQIGISLAPMIRAGKVHGIACTGANLEEDIFMLVAHDEYVMIPEYRDLTPADETRLMKKHLNRVTDTAIPEKSAMTPIEKHIAARWRDADKEGESKFPHEFLWDVLRAGELEEHYQGDPDDSWVIAALEMDVPIYVPGWEDSTLGNVYAAMCESGEIENVHTVKGGIEYMLDLTTWYKTASKDASIGFFQIGGGIAGDFSICVVPLLKQDAQPKVNVPLWGYFCQISDSTTSYGSYSGAVPNEKITWGKIGPETPRHVIESDASIVAPLIFGYLLGW